MSEEERKRKQQQQQQRKKKKPQKGAAAALKGGEEEKEEEELSEEDQRLKEDIALLVQRVQDTDTGVQALALDRIIAEIRTATASMTSVPKVRPLLREAPAAATAVAFFFPKKISPSFPRTHAHAHAFSLID
jgi:26S proteasome regulatory subunit N1